MEQFSTAPVPESVDVSPFDISAWFVHFGVDNGAWDSSLFAPSPPLENTPHDGMQKLLQYSDDIFTSAAEASRRDGNSSVVLPPDSSDTRTSLPSPTNIASHQTAQQPIGGTLPEPKLTTTTSEGSGKRQRHTPLYADADSEEEENSENENDTDYCNIDEDVIQPFAIGYVRNCPLRGHKAKHASRQRPQRQRHAQGQQQSRAQPVSVKFGLPVPRHPRFKAKPWDANVATFTLSLLN